MESVFVKLYLCVFHVSVNCQMCKSGILRNGGTKDQGNDLQNGSVAGERTMGGILPSDCQWMQMKGNLVLILTYIWE